MSEMSEPASDSVMSQLLSAWDEVDTAEPVEKPEETTPEPPETEEEVETKDEPEPEPEESEAEDVVAGEEDTEEEPEEEGEAEEEETESEPVSFSTTDPAILAYLARYDNSPEKALKAAVELQRVITRQGTEKNQALARVQELEQELAQAQMFQSGPAWLSDEQREYVNGAVASDNPLPWVQQAVKAGEFDLARAITEEWANESPFPAMRAAQMVDQAEAQSSYEPQPQGQGFDQSHLLELLVDNFPEMPRYEQQMVTALQKLGDNHPLVLAAKSQDPQEAARAIIGLYEIAKASSTSVASARQKVRQKAKEDAAAARQAAVVSSGSASPSGGETPRKMMIAPGLSLEDLDSEFAQHSQ